jgi:multicomponent Na+:H+ antiporter subunit C
METILALLIGALYAASFYLMLRRSLMKLVLGLMIFGHAVHLLIFTAAGLTEGNPAFIAEGEKVAAAPFADPLPQALILTAIVISFGVLAFSLALVRRTHQTMGTDDLDALKEDES